MAIDDGHVMLVEQYRVPLGRACLELPAGLVGDEKRARAAEASAARELEEETGYRAAHVTSLGTFYASPGMVSECFTLVRAEGLTKVSDGGGTADENITVHRVPLADIADFVAERRAAGSAIDVKLLAAGAGCWLINSSFLRRREPSFHLRAVATSAFRLRRAIGTTGNCRHRPGA